MLHTIHKHWRVVRIKESSHLFCFAAFKLFIKEGTRTTTTKKGIKEIRSSKDEKEKKREKEREWAKAIRTFTSNKKMRCISFYACRVFITFYSLNSPVDHFTIHTRFLFSNHFKFPSFDLCKSITFFMVAQKTLPPLLPLSCCQMCIFTRDTTTYLYFYTIRIYILFMAKNANLSMLYRFYFIFFYRRICTHSSSNDLSSYVWISGEFLIHTGFIHRRKKTTYKTNK